VPVWAFTAEVEEINKEKKVKSKSGKRRCFREYFIISSVA
jgi:hypothetical protein